MSLHIFQLKRLAITSGIAAALVLASAARGTAQPIYAAPDAAVKFEVKPKQALVYVDGYYAGIVDDYDGTFQRLYTTPGPHEMTLFLEGYRTRTEKVYLAPDHTFKVRFQMEKLAPGETAEKPPTPSEPPPSRIPFPDGPNSPSGRRQPPPRGGAPQDVPPGQAQERSNARGTLELTLQPADADVLVDGQSWPRSGADRITIDLSEGPHNVQVRKAGYTGFLTEVDIRAGETTPLNVTLRAQPQR